MFSLVLGVWILAAMGMFGLWILQRGKPNAAIADFGYCIGLGQAVIGYGILIPGDPTRRVLLAVMGSIYGFRLACHLFVNRIYEKPEDSRYQTLRRKWGTRGNLYFFIYFQGQAISIVVFSLPFLVLMYNPNSTLALQESIGILIWAIAVTGEALADFQLEQFRASTQNYGRTCQQGLWRYSRHPNYFFEGLHWCAYVVMGIGIPYGWVTMIGPVLMIGTLLKFSGIPFAEAQALVSRGEDYQAYQRSTNAFIPWFPKRSPDEDR